MAVMVVALRLCLLPLFLPLLPFPLLRQHLCQLLRLLSPRKRLIITRNSLPLKYFCL